MTGTRINRTVTKTIVYDSAKYPGPLTVTSNGAVLPEAATTDGIDVPTAIKSAEITNDGTVSGAIGGGIGVDALSSISIRNLGSVLGGNGENSHDTFLSGGVGIALQAGGEIVNLGDIKGGTGGFNYNGYASLALGGIGITLSAGGKIVNDATITGGEGGRGYFGNGGAGAAGVDISAGGMVQNSGIITGGVGGSQDFYFGDGGRGGDGIDFAGRGKIVNTGHIAGGVGGYGSATGGTGVDLQGGMLTNDASGTIIGGYGGYGGEDTPGGNGGIGVTMAAGTSLTDLGTITGGAGAAGAYYGGSGAVGISMTDATAVIKGSVTGGAGGFGQHIYGGSGVFINGGSLTVAATGTVTGGAGYNDSFIGGSGIVIESGTVHVEGTVSGGAGTYGFHAGNGVTLETGTLVVSGTIAGSLDNEGNQSDAVVVSGSATVELDPGAVFVGVVAATGAGDILNLGGSGSGTISGIGTAFTGFTTLSENAGASWIIAGTNTLGAGTQLLDAGTLSVTGTLVDTGSAAISGKGELLASGGGFAHLATVTLAGGTLATDSTSSLAIGEGMTHPPAGILKIEANFAATGYGTIAGPGGIVVSGTITAQGGTLSLADGTSGTGGIGIDSGSALAVLGNVSTASLSFMSGGNEKLLVSAASTITTALSGFGAGDVIDVAKSSTSLAYSNGTLTLSQHGSVVETLLFAGNYTQGDFALKSDGHGGSDILYAGTDAGAFLRVMDDHVWPGEMLARLNIRQ